MRELEANILLDSKSETTSTQTLSLKCIPSQGTSPISIEVDFTPLNQSKNSGVSTVPCFNSDKKHFTPAFWIPSVMNTEENLEDCLMRNFQNKKKQYSHENKSLLQPKPESKYCQICHQYFQDYMKHIEHTVHLKKVKEGNMQAEITKLITLFKSTEIQSVKRKSPVFSVVSEKTLPKNSSLEDDCRMVVKSSKKIKTDFDICSNAISSTETSENDLMQSPGQSRLISN